MVPGDSGGDGMDISLSRALSLSFSSPPFLFPPSLSLRFGMKPGSKAYMSEKLECIWTQMHPV